jgi:hypothetical protein
MAEVKVLVGPWCMHPHMHPIEPGIFNDVVDDHLHYKLLPVCVCVCVEMRSNQYSNTVNMTMVW